MTILADILLEKMAEVERLKATHKDTELKRTQPIRSFYQRCQKSDGLNIIAEFKRASPSKGLINPNLDPAAQAKAYQAAGASMISVLTDQPFFQGTMNDLLAVRQVVDLPILNKDFIIDPVQIDRAYVSGADVILLIVAALSEEKLTFLFQYATDLGLEVLVEVHNQAEMHVAQRLGSTLIGVNNRNLKTFEVDLAITEQLAASIDPAKQVLISESGMKTSDDVARVKAAGANAILVGETMMKSEDVKQTFNDFISVGEDHVG
ncbi:indole-3-glycerol phosphate synthase TrpC [Amphibacillus jilinensis]|uniref:indole-3-glycerol phosphate synthase TrpC n=1 Tax=Amphibacillus jilinensis TaxID=1216008 RepID=UPI0002F0827D|nr:indole-3-glycerol phosphate synthase TrpC [Amphibacillus jilinensis]